MPLPFVSDLQLVPTLVGAAIGVAFTEGYNKLIKPYFERKGPLDGEWMQVIPAHDGRPEQRDLVTLIHRGELLEGKVRGEWPEARRGRRWHFTGTARFGVIFGHFWSTNSSSGSFGSVYVRETSSDAVTFHGTYTRLHIDPDKGICERANPEVEWRRMPKD